MKRCVAIFLLFTMTCLGTGASEWLHVAIEHPRQHAQQPSGHACAQARRQVQLHVGIDTGTDEDHCLVCASLHAPVLASARVALEVQMGLVVDRTIALQAQRIDASVPARRGCRGPPVM